MHLQNDDDDDADGDAAAADDDDAGAQVGYVDRGGVEAELPRSTQHQRKARRQSAALPTLAPSDRRRLVFDGRAFLQYDLQVGLPPVCPVVNRTVR